MAKVFGKNKPTGLRRRDEQGSEAAWSTVTVQDKGMLVAQRFVDIRKMKPDVTKDILPSLSTLGFNKQDMFDLPKGICITLDRLNIEYVSYLLCVSLILVFGTSTQTPITYHLSKESMVHLYHHCVIYLLHTLGEMNHLLCSNGQCSMNNVNFWSPMACFCFYIYVVFIYIFCLYIFRIYIYFVFI